MKKLLTAFLLAAVVVIAGCVSPPNTNSTGNVSGGVTGDTVMEKVMQISMDSFVTFPDGKPAPRFSLSEIVVEKGTKLRINVRTINGTHDFNIDEYNVHEATPTGEVTTIEFTADRVGEFVYYCNMPGHRANGHWGTLRVMEEGTAPTSGTLQGTTIAP